MMFDDATEMELVEALTLRVASTPATRERYAFLRTKRKGATWQEGPTLYRMGATGVTVFNPDSWFGYSDRPPSETPRIEWDFANPMVAKRKRLKFGNYSICYNNSADMEKGSNEIRSYVKNEPFRQNSVQVSVNFVCLANQGVTAEMLDSQKKRVIQY